MIHCAGIVTRSRFFAHRNMFAIRANETELTLGSRMLSVHCARVEVAGFPLASCALFREAQVRWCIPTPLTGTRATAAACQTAGPPSSEHEMPATPDGPAAAVALMY